MITPYVLEKHLHSRHHEALLDALIANGLDVPLSLRVRLAEAPAAVMGMALRRLLEVTYAPTPVARQLAGHLLEMQDADGGFHADPLATACAYAGLSALARELPEEDPALTQACEQALQALANRQILETDAGESILWGRNPEADAPDDLAPAAVGFRSPADRCDQQRTLVAAFILMLLSGDARFLAAVQSAALLDWFESAGQLGQLDDDTQRLWNLARMEAPPAAMAA